MILYVRNSDKLQGRRGGSSAVVYKNHTEKNKVYSCSPPKKKRQTKVQVQAQNTCLVQTTLRVVDMLPETYPIKRSNIKQDQDN